MAWGGEVSAEHQLVTGVPHGSVLGPSSSPLHYITGSHHTSTWFLLPFLRWWHTAVSLNSTWWSNGSCTDLRLPGEHLCMDERTSSTAQPGKDWASCLPCNSPTLLHDFTIQLGSSTITLSSSVRNLGIIFDDHLTFKDHIAKTARSCRFALLNIRKIRPFLTEHAAQIILSFLGWTTAMLFWLDFHNAQSNLYRWFRMQQLNWSSANPKGPMSHLSLSPCSSRLQLASSSTLMRTYRTATGSAPPTSTHWWQSTPS